jgi:uncharacterized protein (TIGR00255 family)
MHAMRQREGTALAKDIHGRIQALKDHRLAVAGRAPILLQEGFERMKQRIEKLLGGEAPDVPRLHQELAMYADRGDITEEIVRLDSHMLQFEEHLKARNLWAKPWNSTQKWVAGKYHRLKGEGRI